MLLEFSVSNFRSIADKQKLTMVAARRTHGQPGRIFETGNSFAPLARCTASLLGANGSGKTSLVRALQFFQTFIVSSAKDRTEGEKIGVTPFKLEPSMRSLPSEFEVIFVTESALYQYGFSADSDRIWSEWLFSRPNESGTRMRELFQREYDKDEGTYKWAINETHVRGEREIWKSATRSNALFLSTAVQLNSETLKDAFIWLSQHLRAVLSPEAIGESFSARQCLESGNKGRIIKFLQAADLNIVDVLIEEVEFPIPTEVEKIFSASALREARKRGGLKRHDVTTVHLDRMGNPVFFKLNEESSGTALLFSLAGPWLDVLDKGLTLVIDELHTALHPLALRYLVELFHNPALNKTGAQLIFTTHDATVLSGGLMHRDEIWLLEKGEDAATHLYPLSDFAIRDVAAFEKSYLGGKYGGLPHIRHLNHVEE